MVADDRQFECVSNGSPLFQWIRLKCVNYFTVRIESTLTNKRSVLRIVLSTISIVGIACTVYYTQERNKLRRALTEMQMKVGVWKVEDESKVVIAHVPLAEDEMPPGIGKSYVWQYRIHFPAKYAAYHDHTAGLVKANGPGGEGSRGTCMSGQHSEPKQELATMAFLEVNGRWKFYVRVGGNSNTSTLPPEFSIESLDKFIVEAVVKQDEIRVFDVNEAICLLRLHEKESATDRRGKTIKDLHRGCSVYLYSQEQQDHFTAWAQGQRDSMKESQQ